MLETQYYNINLGPQHPSTHGVFRILLTLDGEKVVKAEPMPGYLHRGVEKLAEARTYTQFIPYTDRLDYLGAMLQNWGYVMAVEKMMEIEVPERAEYMRVLCGELSRMTSHLIATGTYSMDIGGVTGFEYCLRERETVMDLLEELTGSRMTLSYARIGGVAADAPEGWLDKVDKFIEIMPAYIDEYEGLIAGNEIFQIRTKNVGVIAPETAISYSLSGPVLRASGINYDLRKAKPYSVYDRIDFDVPLGTNGDCFDRFYCRLQEMRQILRILKQAVAQIREVDGPVLAKVPKALKPPIGDVYEEIESSKGIIGYYVVSDGSTKPYRIHVRRPSFINLGYMDEMVKGVLLADVIAILGSLDIILGEVDC